jgi:predicted AlkP superfamily pyrophosphatase or phosphodiesterase
VIAQKAIVISIDGLAAFYWTEPAARMAGLRALAERGVVAARMETVFPSTTWPTHASLVTGVAPDRHGVVGNSILNRRTGAREDLTGDPVYDAPDLLRAPTVYDLAHAAGLTTAAVDWPATRNSPSLHFNLPFFKDQRVFETQTSRAVWAELAALGYPLDRQGEWAALPMRFLKDAMVADVASHAWHRWAPRLLLVHFLCVDSFQHLHGPRSPEAYWAIDYVDGLIRRFLATLPADELTERTAVFVVSDHGFLPVAHDVRVNARLRQLGVLRADPAGGVTSADARFVTNHGAGYLYCAGVGDPVRLARDLAAELARIEGVAHVWTEREYPALGLPTLAQNPRVGDLLLEATPGYAFADDAHGDAIVGAPRYRGNHGHLPTHPDNGAFFLAAGSGIVRGRTLATVRSRDVGPTVACVLGLRMDATDGRVLEEILAA